MIARDGVKMPRRGTTLSCGYDFFSPDTYELRPNEWTMIDTGVSLLGYPENAYISPMNSKERFEPHPMWYDRWFMLLAPRSGLSTKYGFRLRNTVGIIDMDYRDTIKAMVTVDEPYTLQKDEKFMQGIIIPFATFTGEIIPTEERKGGHGSTGRF